MQNYVTFAKKKVLKRVAKDKNYQKVRDHWRNASKYRGAGHLYL